MKRRHFLPLLPALAATLIAADYAVEGQLWWSHIEYLADDKLEGRNVGTEGYSQAVAYVSGQFDKIGLKPAGTSGYLQPVKLESRQLVPEQTRLTLIRGGKEDPVALGQEATLSARGELNGTIDVPMVFIGYGMSIPEARWDELAGMNLRGKIAVYVNAPAPVDVSDNIKSHFSSAAERWAVVKRADAIGIVTLPNPRPGAPAPNAETTGAPGRSGAAGRGDRGGGAAPPAFGLADPAFHDWAGQTVAIALTQRGAEKFFAGSGHTIGEIEQLAKDNKPLPRFALAGTLRVSAQVKSDMVDSGNVVGMLPGSDPKLKDEYVIMSAHLDHLGIGRPVNGDSIYNGAMDDASGIASMIEIARMLKGSGAKLGRSVVFLAVTAEEKGLLGSKYFAGHPTVAKSQIVADINLDMFLPLYPLKVIEVQGLTESTLGDQVRDAAKELGVEVQTDREPEQNRFIRSDQYSFIRSGVPALAFKFGYEAGSPDEKTRRDWVRDRYHRPSDDLAQPVDREAAAKFNRVIVGLIQRVANDPAQPKWKDDSFFKRFAK